MIVLHWRPVHFKFNRRNRKESLSQLRGSGRVGGGGWCECAGIQSSEVLVIIPSHSSVSYVSFW